MAGVNCSMTHIVRSLHNFLKFFIWTFSFKKSIGLWGKTGDLYSPIPYVPGTHLPLWNIFFFLKNTMRFLSLLYLCFMFSTKTIVCRRRWVWRVWRGWLRSTRSSAPSGIRHNTRDSGLKYCIIVTGPGGSFPKQGKNLAKNSKKQL